MSHATRRFIPAIMACAVGIGAGSVFADVPATQPSQTEMQQQIQQLQAKVQTLETKQDQNQADMTAAIQQVLSESDQNSDMMGSLGSGSGWDAATGFHLGSEDGNFYLHPFALFQFRAVGNYRGGVKKGATGVDVPVAGTNTSTGFEIRRLKLGAEGHLYSPNLGYYFMVDTNRKGGGLTLDDAYVTYRLDDTSPFTVQGGQFKDFAWHESNVDDAYQLAAEESVLNALIGGTFGGTGGLGSDQARVQGIALMYQQGAIHAKIGLHDGYGSQNTAFFDVANGALVGVPQAVNWGFSGRAEYMFEGSEASWKDYDRFSAYGDKTDLIVAGAGFDYTEAGSSKMFDWTFDAQYNATSGLSVYGALLGQYLADQVVAKPANIPSTANSWGWLVQAGYMISPQWEPFVRYDYTNLDGNLYSIAGFGEHSVHEMTAGVNYYLHGHDCKVTVDGTYLPNGSPADLDGLGILTNNDHPEWLARFQFQLKI